MDDPDFDSLPWPPGREHLRALLDEVLTDAYGDDEQLVALLTAFQDLGGLPRPATVAGREVTLVDVQDRDPVLVATVLEPDGGRLTVPLEDVRPADGTPAAFLVAAYRQWRCLEPSVLPSPSPPEAPSGFEAVRERVQALSDAALVDLVCALYGASPANRALVHRTLGLPAPGSDPELLARSKDKLARYVAPHHDEPFQLDAVSDVLDHYSTSTGDHRGSVELAVHTLERGADAMAAYGDLFDQFYETLIDVAHRCVEELLAEPALVGEFWGRIEAILSATRGMSWCGDALHEVLCELEPDEE